MGRMSFTQELETLATASEGMDAGGCWREVIFLLRELGRAENALGRAAWTMRYGQRGEWRTVLREAAAATLREARRAASVYDTVRLREAGGCYSRLAGCGYGQVAELMLKPEERRGNRPSCDRRERGSSTSHRRCAGSESCRRGTAGEGGGEGAEAARGERHWRPLRHIAGGGSVSQTWAGKTRSPPRLWAGSEALRRLTHATDVGPPRALTQTLGTGRRAWPVPSPTNSEGLEYRGTVVNRIEIASSCA
jgi:hypothetical protein